MDVYIYKAKGKGGTIYDFSFNPCIDFEVLKNTRKVGKFEIIGQTNFEKAKLIMDKIYSNSIVNKLFKNSDKLIKGIFKRYGVIFETKKINASVSLPLKKDIEFIEGKIIGRILTLQELINFSREYGIDFEYLLSIIQVLYCERRIQIVPAFFEEKNKLNCYFCKKNPCKRCQFNFKQNDLLLYAADNYNVSYVRNFTFKKPILNKIEEDTAAEILRFVKSKKSNGLLYSAPFSYSIRIFYLAMIEILKKGGKILYITSFSEVNEALEILKSIFPSKKIGVINMVFDDFEDFDIVISYKSNFIRFYKAFDFVILNDIYRCFTNEGFISFAARKAIKDRGKFFVVTLVAEKYNDANYEIIYLPFAFGNHLIPEPRLEISRFLREDKNFIPSMAIEILKWSLKENIKTIIFVPNEESVYGILNNLSFYGIKSNLIDYSENYLSFLNGDKKIYITYDFKIARNMVENINVIVMNSHLDVYNDELLIYMSSMASINKNKKIGEVLFVAEHETEGISLAKKCIRSLNKVAWDRGYVKL